MKSCCLKYLALYLCDDFQIEFAYQNEWVCLPLMLNLATDQMETGWTKRDLFIEAKLTLKLTSKMEVEITPTLQCQNESTYLKLLTKFNGLFSLTPFFPFVDWLNLLSTLEDLTTVSCDDPSFSKIYSIHCVYNKNIMFGCDKYYARLWWMLWIV